MKDKIKPEELDAFLRHDRYPRSARYASSWIIENEMGSHCLWLTESLSGVMVLRPGMRILDLGCGKALSSIFLAREFACQVWAVDLRIPPSDNWSRAREAGVADLVFPLHGDARALPFPDGFFDAVISINSYWIFGTDDFYLRSHFTRLLKPYGEFGLIVPGLLHDFEDDDGNREHNTGGLPESLPEYIKPFWLEHVIAYHSPRWWRRHLERSGLVDVAVCDNLDDGEGVRIFQAWGRLFDDALTIEDEGRNISFVRLVGRKRQDP